MNDYVNVLDHISDSERAKYKLAEKFDSLSKGAHAPNGRWILPCDVLDNYELSIKSKFSDKNSLSEYNLFREVELLYYQLDPKFNNELCYWNQIPETQEDVDELYSKTETGDTIAMCALGMAHYSKGDYEAAMEWFLKAASFGDTGAMVRLGKEYLNGNPATDKNEDIAIKCYEEAINLDGNASALYILGIKYLQGVVLSKNINKGLSLIFRSALQGSSKARKLLGDLYYDGDIIEKNTNEALKWFELSALGYNVDAYFNLMTVLYDLGDNDSRLLWTRRYIELGEPLAFYYMGVSLAFGQGIERNTTKGLNLMYKALDMGSPLAEYDIAKRLEKANPEDSLRHLRRAASHGMAEAALDYGIMIWDSDQNKALKFIKSAAEQNLEPAITFLRDHGLE